MNIINAIMNLVNRPVTQLVHLYEGNNRANNAGDALEEYIKDLFAGTFGLPEYKRLERINSVFSYLGNSANPPDAMLRGGDAIEVKKITSNGSVLALNSSYPKHTLRASNPLISEACRAAEQWTEKDMLYTIGVVDERSNELRRLCMVYGLDYCASDECYKRIKQTIKSGVEAIPGIEFTESRELGHINRVDPLGITYMRIRGMWGIENPWNVFRYVYSIGNTDTFNFMCIINDDKWATLENRMELTTLASRCETLRIKDILVKNPDNPAQLRGAKLITLDM